MSQMAVRDDKVFSELECDAFLRNELTVEEKVDGANLGISFDTSGNVLLQNRGAYLQLPGHGQWKKLTEWLELHTAVLWEHLTDQYILFGEWCYATHSIFYDNLPDWFLAFDIYNKEAGRFLASVPRNQLLDKMQICKVPCLAQGKFTYSEIQSLFMQSKFGNQPAEGLYLRVDGNAWLEQRAKLVRPTFIQRIDQHWSQAAIRPNRICVRN
ncbi:MAG: RNA ligase family protein [Candidatus Cloacimonetes bacterium]|nr:RNA ligase family protein [Candidatus Cloacimonadota bacterium]